MEKVATFRREVANSIKEGRLRFEDKVKEVLKDRGIRLGSRGAKNFKTKSYYNNFRHTKRSIRY